MGDDSNTENPPTSHPGGAWSRSDYVREYGRLEEILADHRRLVRELDVLLNGDEGAAKQASLIDIIGQVQDEQKKHGARLRLGAVKLANAIVEHLCTDGFGEKATRLELRQTYRTGDVETERGLGGWIKSAAVARVLEKLAPAPDPDVLCVIQQGGSSSEVYLHAFDNEEEVEAYRKGCAEAAYEVSETFKVPESIIAAPGVMDAMEDAAQAAAELVT